MGLPPSAGALPPRRKHDGARQKPSRAILRASGILASGGVAGQDAEDRRLPAGMPRALLAYRPSARYTLNQMVQFNQTRFDASFAALSDATRRGVLDQLGRADASITELAEKFHMTLTGMKKHVSVLEAAGLVITRKAGRVRTCKLGRRALEEEAAWIESYRQLWDARFDALDAVIEDLKRKEKADGRNKKRRHE